MDDPRWVLMAIGAIFTILFVIIIMLDRGEKEYKAWLHKTGLDKAPEKEKE